MTTIDTNHNGGFKIDPNRMLSGKDLMEEAMTMPKEEFSLGNGVTVERRGHMIKFNGSGFENMSPGAFIAAIQASQMGGDAGRAMFDSYRHTNPEDFDGSRTMSAILEKANRSAPSAPDARNAGAKEEAPKTEGTSKDDLLQALDDARMWGLGGSDVMKARNDSTLYGGDGDDTLSANANNELYGGSGNDTLFATRDSNLYGEDGNDTLSGYNYNTLEGGNGNDQLSAYNSSVLKGGAGNDRMSGYANGYFDGGEGSDHISGYDDATVVDLDGNNYVDVYRRANVTTGDGNDWIRAYDNADIQAGHGNNMVTAYDESTVSSGDDADSIQVGRNSTVISGGGDDSIIAGSDSIVVGGTGDDRIQIKGDATIHFAAGDGHDIVSGSRWGQAYSQTENLSGSVLAFGEGITADGLRFQASGNDLVVSINGGTDSITLRGYQRHGIPSMTFSDGTVLSSADITSKVGAGEAYKPQSQVMQKWHDANAAYQASLSLAKNG